MDRDQQEPLELRDEDAVDLGYASDFHILLRAIEETMPEDSILYLEGDATAPAVAEFLRAHEAADRREVVDNASSRTIVVFHLPLADLAQLRLLAEEYASPEIAFHLAVYRGDEILLWAHDAGSGSLLLAGSLPPQTIENMRSALGATLRPYERRGFLALLRRRHE